MPSDKKDSFSISLNIDYNQVEQRLYHLVERARRPENFALRLESIGVENVRLDTWFRGHVHGEYPPRL